MAKQTSVQAEAPPAQSALSRAANSSQKPEVVVLNWQAASNTVLDGKGAWFNGGRLTQLVIQSDFSNGRWRRPKNFAFTNWKINGSIRILGAGSSASDAVRQSSFSLGHTERMQAAAPTGITLAGLKIKADEKIPLIVGPGATNITLKDSKISGQSQSVAIYLDAESANHVIQNNTFSLKADRELIAVDGAKGNLIAGNTFKRLPWGGVYVYRNCGERGVVRHQEPTDNRIIDNIFNLKTLKSYWEENPKNGRQFEYRYGVWLGSRQGGRPPSYCGADQGFPFGSSIDNRDFADDNIVSGNRRIGSNRGYLLKIDEDFGIGGYDKFVRDDGRNNLVTDNRALDSKNWKSQERLPVAPQRVPTRLRGQFEPLPELWSGGAAHDQPRPLEAFERSCGCGLLGSDANADLLPALA
jgi:hypothetical protein